MKTKKILIVEDNVFYANLLRNRIENIAPHEVKLVSDGHSCLNLSHQQPDIIFLDYKLPDMNGLDIIKDLKSTYPQIHIVMLSAQEKIKVAVSSLKYGATDYLVKGRDDSPDAINKIINNCSRIDLNLTNTRKKLSLPFILNKISSWKK